MSKVNHHVDLEKAIKLLKQCLQKQASPDAMKWLEGKISHMTKPASDPIFFMTFSAMSNQFGKELLQVTDGELKQAENIRKHWSLNRWSVVQTARVYLILSYIQLHPEHFKEALDKIFNTADIQELIALYQALPLFPQPEKFILHGTNGIRSNMLSVFEAIALNNPYPTDHFNEIAWNQLVLKTLHVDSAIGQVIGLKERANPALAQALINTVRERFAAGRPIKPELWCIIGFATDKTTWPLLKDLAESNNSTFLRGALLALDHCKLTEAKELFNKYPQQQKEIERDLENLRMFEEHLA